MPDLAPPAAPLPATPQLRPLYQQIKDLLTASLQGGQWRPGEAIPSELELAAHFGVSQGTVRKAIDELAAENLLVRRQGKGTFVATHAEPTTQYRFLRLVPDQGERAGLERRLLDCRRQRAPAEVARALQLTRGEPVIQVRRLLSAGSAPVVLDDIWLPASRFGGLSAERLQAYRGPMYGLFESEFGVRMVRADEKIRALAASPDDAALFGLPPGAPLLSVERTAYTYNDQPVEFRRGLYDTRSHHYRNQLS